MTPLHRCMALTSGLLLLANGASRAEHDLEYVAEHLPEVAMDNRYATLPLWGSSFSESPSWSAAIQGAFSSTEVGSLVIDGPLFAAALRRSLRADWTVSAFGFYDDLAFSGSRELRPLQTLFAPATPLQRPVDAQFTGLDGSAKNYGVGLAAAWRSDDGFLGSHRWLAGVLWQRVELRDYRFIYRILAGPQTGTTGEIDFDADYAHVTPFAGLEIPRDLGKWTVTAHALLAYPFPRRGVAGHITGPAFDLAGDTGQAGNGKHFGDPSVTLGLDVQYRPVHLTIDLGTLLTQALLEPAIHPGVDKNLLVSFSWSF